MILRDHCTLRTLNEAEPAREIRCMVGNAAAQVQEPTFGALYIVEELRMIIEPQPRPWEMGNHRVQWRGVEFFTNTPPIIRRRGDVDHHWTLRLWRVTQGSVPA